MKVNEFLMSSFIKAKLIDEEAAKTVYIEAEKNGRSYFDELVGQKILGADVVYSHLSKLFDIEFIDVPINQIQDNVVSQIDNVFLNETRTVPLKLEQNELVVLIDTPFNISQANLCRYYLNYNVNPKLVTRENLDTILNTISNKDRRIKAIEELQISENKVIKKTGEEYTLDDYLDAPAVQLADSLLQEAVVQGASDIHIEPMESNVRVRFRIDGVLLDHCEISPKLFSAVVARYKIMSSLDIAERRIPQDGKISLVINNNLYDFRISTLPLIYGEKIVIRIYNALGDEIKLANLTKNKRDEAVMRKMINSPHGIILLTGPTGSGKTTTLYSFLKELNTEDVNITTIEDPVENQIKGVNQVQVNTKTGLTFAYTLRSILRQDPDIIMVGEIRDEETAHIAVQAAITGHLVLSTIHTNDAVTTITRLVDMGVEPYLVADSLIGAISQRLVRRLCNHCKKEHIVNAQEAKDLCDITEGTKVFEPCGCPHCNNTGYAGRAPVMEILPIDDDMKQAIDQKIQEFTIEKVKKVFIEKKYDTLKKACSRLVADGTTSIEEYRKLVEFTGQDHTY